MRDKLITLSYIFDGNVLEMKKAIDANIDIKVNEKFIQQLEKEKITAVTIFDNEYPKQLKELYNPPYVIYCRGFINLLQTKMSAIIGSRKNQSYSEKVCDKLVRNLSSDTTIVSGLAVGIDCLAHSYALKYNKNTIAIIGSGFNQIYPKENKGLSELISKNHLLISEYPPNVRANKINFPLRNRIIAALSDDVYVIEAAMKSGSLITANIALELGKNIYCAPGNIFERNFEGSHQLINDGAYLLDFRKED